MKSAQYLCPFSWYSCNAVAFQPLPVLGEFEKLEVDSVFHVPTQFFCNFFSLLDSELGNSILFEVSTVAQVSFCVIISAERDCLFRTKAA